MGRLESKWTSKATVISCRRMGRAAHRRNSFPSMRSVLYLGCPPQERLETEKALGTADVSVVWAETVPLALGELQRRDMPVLLDLSRGAAALQNVREIRAQRGSALLFAVVDSRRPDLTIEAVLAGMADVF